MLDDHERHDVIRFEAMTQAQKDAQAETLRRQEIMHRENSVKLDTVLRLVSGPPDNPERGIHYRLASVEAWMKNWTKVLWTITATIIALVVHAVWKSITGGGSSK